jgi:ribonuclease HI
MKFSVFKAAIIAIKQAIDHNVKELKLYTDSKFTISCITEWIKKWKINGWKLSNGEDVKNAADLKRLDALNSKIKVHWVIKFFIL